MVNTGIDDPHGVLQGSYRVQMYYEDTDFSGYVYHANYLKFFERAREYIFGAQYLKQLYEKNFHFVVASAELSFRHPASFGDTLEIVSTAPFTDSPIIPFTQDAYILSSDTNERLSERRPIVRSKIQLVSVDEKGKPIKIPLEVKTHLLKLANQPHSAQPNTVS